MLFIILEIYSTLCISLYKINILPSIFDMSLIILTAQTTVTPLTGLKCLKFSINLTLYIK
jgi:hypothetical protein